MYAAHHAVLRVLYATGKLDPDGAARAIARGEQKRFDSMGWLADRLHEQKHLRRNVTPEDAAHTIWLLASFDAYDLLASGRSLEPEAVTRILRETAEHALFDSRVMGAACFVGCAVGATTVLASGPYRDRTCDLGIKSPLLYQLS
jgi:hypothetical protein